MADLVNVTIGFQASMPLNLRVPEDGLKALLDAVGKEEGWQSNQRVELEQHGDGKQQATFSLNNSEMNAIRLAKLTDENTDANFLEYSLYGLPLQTQQTFMIMVMIPIGVLVILILRNLIGLQTLGTFTPVLIALAFRETQLGFGILLFTVITALGLSLRSYLEHLKLQMLPRLSVVLTFVVVLIAAISLFSTSSAWSAACRWRCSRW